MTSNGAGLSMYHISPQKVAAGVYIEPEPKISFRRGASLVKVELGKVHGLKGRRVDWRRGMISEFSKQSRRRMLRLVASLKVSERPLFMTLTYPDIFPENPKIWKKNLDAIIKRLLRRFPHAVIIWRLERKARDSGVNVGKLAPHFHFLIYNAAFPALFRWIKQAWFDVAKTGDPKHLNVGSSVQVVRSVKGVLYYTSKYICKAENDSMPGIGRAWGIAGREDLPDIQGEFQVLNISGKSAMMILRMMHRRGSQLYRRGRYIGRRKIPRGGVAYTLICDAEFWYTALPKIQSLAG